MDQITYCVWTWSSRMETTTYNHFAEIFEKCFEISFALQRHKTYMWQMLKNVTSGERESSAFIYRNKQTSAKIQAHVKRSAYRIWFWEGVCMYEGGDERSNGWQLEHEHGNSSKNITGSCYLLPSYELFISKFFKYCIYWVIKMNLG